MCPFLLARSPVQIFVYGPDGDIRSSRSPNGKQVQGTRKAKLISTTHHMILSLSDRNADYWSKRKNLSDGTTHRLISNKIRGPSCVFLSVYELRMIGTCIHCLSKLWLHDKSSGEQKGSSRSAQK